jgi:hypothetical protein
MLHQVSAQINNMAHNNRAPFTRSTLFVPADGGEITLRSSSAIFREFTSGRLVDDKLAQASLIYDKFVPSCRE